MSIVSEAMKRDGWNPPWYLEKLYEVAKKYDGEPALEIGLWHGRTASVLVAAGLDVTAVDIDVKPEATDLPIKTIQGDSKETLFGWPRHHFSLVHIDGDHTAPTVNADVFNGWNLVRPGGVLCGDDLEEPDVSAAVFGIGLLPEVTVYRGRFWVAPKPI